MSRGPLALTTALWGLLALAALGALAGCAAQSDHPPPDTLVVLVQGDAKSLDPHEVTDAASMRMIENMYSTLLRYGHDYRHMALKPDLARSWKVSEDHLTYTFHLTPDAHFHHGGRPVRASDVKYSLQRIMKSGARASQFAAVRAIRAPGPLTVVLELDRPDAPLLTHLANPMNAIVDRRVIDAHGGDLRDADAGCGPYELVHWRRGQDLKLRANPGYHVPGLPKTRFLVYRPTPDQTARATAIRTGEADLLLQVPDQDRGLLEAAPQVKVIAKPGTFWEYVGMNCRRPPLDDRRVRRAVAWAIDRGQLNRAIKFGHATPLTGGPIPPNHWAYADLSIHTHPDPAKARALLQQAGYGSGLRLTMAVDASIGYQVRAAEMVKQQLRQVGIAVTLRSLEPGVFYNKLNRHDFQLSLVGWVGFVDPDQWLHPLFHTGGKYNQQGYTNPQVDQLIERGQRTLDRAKRKAIYTKAQRLIVTDAPMAFLYVNPQTTAIRDAVTGYFVHPTGTTIFLRSAQVHR